ncbi:hypothetical protein OROGR_018235 [Orobanche gracilis]
MSWFWTILLFMTFAFSCKSSESKHHKRSSAMVVGTVYCDTCFQKGSIPKATTHFIAGASVAVECKNTRRSSTSTFRQVVKTDNHGRFKVNLPFPVTKHLIKKISRCSVKLIASNSPYCSVAAGATSSDLHLQSRKNGAHIFSAGSLTFCDSIKPSEQSEDVVSRPDPFPFPNPFQPPPSLIPPVFPTPAAPSILPPLFPSPPSLIPPVFPTPAAPSILPPLFPSPPSQPFFHLPPIPSLTPVAPPPPPPVFSIPLPPFPFQPIPGFPGVPPAQVSPTSKINSP